MKNDQKEYIIPLTHKECNNLENLFDEFVEMMWNNFCYGIGVNNKDLKRIIKESTKKRQNDKS